MIPVEWPEERGVKACEQLCAPAVACLGFTWKPAAVERFGHHKPLSVCCFRAGSVADKPKCDGSVSCAGTRCYEKSSDPPSPPPPPGPCPLDVWPAPQSVSVGARGTASALTAICPGGVNVACTETSGDSAACNQIVLPAVARMRATSLYLLPANITCPAGTPVFELAITIAASAPLQHAVNESFSLEISDAGNATHARLAAATEWGALNGLAILGQVHIVRDLL